MTVATYYYLDDWTDEVMPCQPTLESWADWLSKPDQEWQREAAETPGSLLNGSTLIVVADLPFCIEEGVVSLPTIPTDGEEVFLRHGGPDTGWDADAHTYRGAEDDSSDDGFRRDVLKMLRENVCDGDGDGYLAVVRKGPDFVARFDVTSDGPKLTIEGTVQ